MALITRQRYIATILIFAVIALVVLCLAPGFGSTRIDAVAALGEWLSVPRSEFSVQAEIIDFRLPQVLLGFFAGGALALAGAVFQALLRNPLATPYTLGVAGGGSFGAVLAINLSGVSIAGMALPALDFSWGVVGGLQIFSLMGSLGAVFVIYLLARSKARLSTMALLLAGVTIGLICSAGILFLRYLARPQLLVQIDRYLMGGLDIASWRVLWPILPLLIIGVAILLMQARRFDQLSYGEELAAGRGVNVHRLQLTSFFAGSLVTASVVAVTGPIGFVGLIVPHIVRRIVGPDHRLLLPCSLLGGGAFLVICDTIARSAFAPRVVPVGILTAFIGGPFFLFLLIRSRGHWGRTLQ